MELETALTLARDTHEAVLVTLRRDSRPQLSNVLQHTGDDGTIRISTTADRAKYHNLSREPWAAVHVDGDSFWSYAVLEGGVDLTPVAADPGDETVEELVDLYRSLSGEHDDWEDYRRAMVEQRRVVVAVRPNRAYGLVR